jgi:Fe-S-cluster formation regulator IscX/YfhJ
MSLFEYALLRVVPRVERGEFINAGVVLYCQDARFLDARVHLDAERLRALDPDLDPGTVLRHLEVARLVCEGGPEAGAVGLLPPAQRFGWLVAPRSTVVQPSPVHTGFTDDPEEAIERLLRVMVCVPT